MTPPGFTPEMPAVPPSDRFPIRPLLTKIKATARMRVDAAR